jgi:hypothetical protein
MLRKHFRGARPSVAFTLWGAAVLSCATPSNAQSPRAKERRACASQYEKAQELRQASKLRQSKDAMLRCAKPACGDFVQGECTRWLSQIDAEMPSVAIAANDEAGQPVLDVEVTMDGEKLASRLDGRALPVDPGMHDFSFKTPTGAVVDRRIAISLGERNRVIVVKLVSPKPAPAAPPAPSKPESGAREIGLALVSAPPVRPANQVASSSEPPVPEAGDKGSSSLLPYVVGGVGLVGVGGYALFYTMAKTENNAMLEQCWPSCSEGRLDRVRNLYLASHISLGAGMAAIGTATFLYFQLNSGSDKPAKQSARYVVDVTPSRSGVLATVSGVF